MDKDSPRLPLSYASLRARFNECVVLKQTSHDSRILNQLVCTKPCSELNKGRRYLYRKRTREYEEKRNRRLRKVKEWSKDQDKSGIVSISQRASHLPWNAHALCGIKTTHSFFLSFLLVADGLHGHSYSVFMFAQAVKKKRRYILLKRCS